MTYKLMEIVREKLWTTSKKQQNPCKAQNQGWLERKVQEAFYQCHLSATQCSYCVTVPWVLNSLGFDLPSLGCATAALCPTPVVLSHGFDLLSPV